MINNVTLVGRLTKDPELRVSQNNISVTSFTLAINRPFTASNGERGADFINIVVFRKQAKNANQYLSKGALCGVTGRLQSRSYDNKDGQRVFVVEVVADSVQFLEYKNENKQEGQTYQRPQNGASANSYGAETRGQQQRSASSQSSSGAMDIPDDDLPF